MTWMTTRETAQHAGRCEGFIREAASTYVATKGRKGLKGSQSSGVRGHWRFRLSDVDRWLEGK